MIAQTRRTFTIAELRSYARRVAANRRQLRAAHGPDGLSERLREQIKYGVALTNQCRHCQVAHETFALHTGSSPDELAAIVGGDAAVFEPATWTAILYAQALAANDFAPQPALRAETESFLGPRAADLVEATALEMTVANRCGNTYDALLHRVHDGPVPESRVIDEIAVSAVFLLGALVSALRVSRLRREAPHHVLSLLFSRPENFR
ncbi:MAG: carboxymuconolactone decarboxylase family protein [Mycobacterium sp.]|nr:carboxymuconolactone decarboxylase family protein [Mycobacterium sp.]